MSTVVRTSQSKQLVRMNRFFFDRAEVIAATTKAERRVMNRAGGLTRKIARQSIRKRKKISNPGQPPSSRKGFLRKGIMYSYDPRRSTVTVGPERRQSGRLNYVAPQILEFGGTITRRKRADRIRQRFQKRPFMRPALDKVAPRFPGLWKNSIG